MTTEAGIAVTAWTARLAMAGYAARLWIDVTHPRNLHWQRRARWCWTSGCGLFCLHVLAAFHVYHHWSHAAAWEHTRQQTLARTGFDSGSGLWLNYLFLVIWLCDVAAWWRDATWPRQRLWYLSTQSFMAFMALNATAVFGPPAWIPLVAVFVVLLWWGRKKWVVGSS